MRVDRLSAIADTFDGVLIDQFGVIHDGQVLYPGVLAALESLAALAVPVAVLTNSGKRAAANRDRLVRMGVPRDHFIDVVSSGEVAVARNRRHRPAAAGVGDRAGRRGLRVRGGDVCRRPARRRPDPHPRVERARDDPRRVSCAVARARRSRDLLQSRHADAHQARVAAGARRHRDAVPGNGRTGDLDRQALSGHLRRRRDPPRPSAASPLHRRQRRARRRGRSCGRAGDAAGHDRRLGGSGSDLGRPATRLLDGVAHVVTLDRLRTLSARVGADPLLVQAAGGNTSLKDDGVMWIKASGTWLKDAASRDIFVPIDQAALVDALVRHDPAADACLPFVRADLNSTGLRPSIETSVHALMPHRIVVHVHCVNTIAWAIRDDAEARLADSCTGVRLGVRAVRAAWAAAGRVDCRPPAARHRRAGARQSRARRRGRHGRRSRGAARSCGVGRRRGPHAGLCRRTGTRSRPCAPARHTLPRRATTPMRWRPTHWRWSADAPASTTRTTWCFSEWASPPTSAVTRHWWPCRARASSCVPTPGPPSRRWGAASGTSCAASGPTTRSSHSPTRTSTAW